MRGLQFGKAWARPVGLAAFGLVAAGATPVGLSALLRHGEWGELALLHLATIGVGAASARACFDVWREGGWFAL